MSQTLTLEVQTEIKSDQISSCVDNTGDKNWVCKKENAIGGAGNDNHACKKVYLLNNEEVQGLKNEEFVKCRKIIDEKPIQNDNIQDDNGKTGKQSNKSKKLDWFEKLLPLWIIICTGIGILLSTQIDGLSSSIEELKVGDVNIPIGICLFIMMYPALLNLKFEEIKKVILHPKPIAATLAMNWLVAPFLNAYIGKAILQDREQLIISIILLGASPCTAMVLVWGDLADGNQEQNLINTSLNTITIIFLYPPMVKLLTGIQDIPLDWISLIISAVIFIGLPLAFGLISKTIILKAKGKEWFDKKFKAVIGKLSILALLCTLIVIFAMNGKTLIKSPMALVWVSIPLLVCYPIIVCIATLLTKVLKLKYKEACITILIGSSSHFEIAIAVAVSVYGVDSEAALGTTMGLFWEVPIMLSLVYFLRKLRAKNFFNHDEDDIK